MKFTGKDDRRSHVRFTGFELCRIVVKGQEYEGAVANLSVGGAATLAQLRGGARHLEISAPVTEDKHADLVQQRVEG